VHGGHSYYVKETKGFSLDRVFAHTSILLCTAELLLLLTAFEDESITRLTRVSGFE